jgi:hypothetical protein
MKLTKFLSKMARFSAVDFLLVWCFNLTILISGYGPLYEFIPWFNFVLRHLSSFNV